MKEGFETIFLELPKDFCVWYSFSTCEEMGGKHPGNFQRYLFLRLPS